MVDLAAERTEVLFVRLVLAGHGEREQGPAMVAVRERDDRGPARVFARDLHRVFGRFGAGREQQRLLPRKAGRAPIEFFGNANVRLVHRHLETCVRIASRLLGDRGDDLRMAVAGVERADPADEIDVTAALDVPKDRAAGTRDPNRMGGRDAPRDALLGDAARATLR